MLKYQTSGQIFYFEFRFAVYLQTNQMDNIKISAVSYLNTLPFLRGLQSSSDLKNCHIELDHPAECARKLVQGEADLGLVPVAILPQLKNYKIISDFCIGAVGPVSSVMLYSQVPLKNIEEIWLDYQSRTSVALVRVLAKNYWHIEPKWLEALEGYEKKIEGSRAGVIIGDRTFGLNSTFNYQYDLSKEWHDFTGLPFVFACWVSVKELPSDFVEEFNVALASGVAGIPALAEEINKSHTYKTDVSTYLTRNLSYQLDDEKRKGLELFLKLLKPESPVNSVKTAF